MLASLDESLDRLGLDYVDIFYSHRIDPVTPLEETIGALDTAVRAGKARYVGISSYSAAKTAEAAIDRAAAGHAVGHSPAVVLAAQPVGRGRSRQPLADAGMGAIAFTALGAGPADRPLSAAARRPTSPARPRVPTFDDELVTEQVRERLQGLAGIAERRGQSLAQLALAWVLRDPTVASTLVGASSVDSSRKTSERSTTWTSPPDELAEIDTYASESGIDLWRESSDI